MRSAPPPAPRPLPQLRGVAVAALLLLATGATTARAAGDAPADPFANPPAADVLILGEVHDNPDHHLNQARAVAAVSPAAVVYEMLTPELAARVTPELTADPGALATTLEWEDRGWPDFDLYAPIFAASPMASVRGGGLPVAEVRRAISQGAATVMGSDAARFALDQPLPSEEQDLREAGQMADHCDALPPEMLPGMVEAQRLRDAAIARAALQAYEETGGPVVVITGNGHARPDWGVPALLAVAAPDLRVVAIGQSEGEVPAETPFQLIAASPPAPREDPCLAFTRR
ncbi:putative iron-regulated protein [Brevirhabdus pacifica]|nr:putative iron-regulated protein [Brevirhabdus pacifica]